MNISQEYILQNFGEKINNLKVRMAQHIANGGSLYDSKKQRPYYDYMDYVFHEILKHDETLTRAELHQLCGFEYDTEYNEYTILLNMLKQYADENNFVDNVKKSKGIKSAKTLLQKFATDMNVSPSDYLILMTPYRYAHNTYIKLGNNPNLTYLNRIETMTREVYPVGANATGLKREHPHLYEAFRNYLGSVGGESLGIFTMADLFDYLQLQNDYISAQTPAHNSKKYQLLKKVKDFYPDGNINKIIKEHYNEYIALTRLARQEKLSITNFFKENNLNYTIGQEVNRLGRIQVEPNRREKEILTVKNNLLSQYNHKSNLESPVAIYRFKKEIANKTMEILNNPVSTQ